MKAYLAFNMDDEQDRERFLLMQKAVDMSIVLDEMDNAMRQIVKYESEGYTAKELAMCKKIRETLLELRREYEA